MDWFYPHRINMSYKLFRTMKKTLITALFQIASNKDLVNLINLLKKHLKMPREMLCNVKQKTKNYKRKYKNKKQRNKNNKS